MVAGFSGHGEHFANVAKSQRIYFHFRYTLKKINQSTFLNTKSQSILKSLLGVFKSSKKKTKQK